MVIMNFKDVPNMLQYDLYIVKYYGNDITIRWIQNEKLKYNRETVLIHRPKISQLLHVFDLFNVIFQHITLEQISMLK